MDGPRPADEVPVWAVARLDEARLMLSHSRFEEAVELTTRCGDQARADGRLAAWGRFGTFRAIALTRLGAARDALEIADEVAASAGRDGELLVEAACAAALAANRIPDDDVMLARLDLGLAEAEHLLTVGAGPEALGKAALVAATVGIADMGDVVYTRVLEATRTHLGVVSPRTLLWIRSQHAMVRLRQALLAEHTGDLDGAAARFAECRDMCRDIIASLPDPALLPPKPRAMLQVIEGYALGALRCPAEAEPLLAAGMTVVTGERFETLTATVEAVHGAAALRSDAVAPDGFWPEATRLAAVAQSAGEVRIEAEIWRQAARYAEATGHAARATIALDRHAELVERLDWRHRLHVAHLLGFRSQTLRLIVQDEVAMAERPSRRDPGQRSS